MGPKACNRAPTLMIASSFPSFFASLPSKILPAEVVIWRWQSYAINIHGVATAETFSMQNVGLNNGHVLSKMSQFHIRDAVRGSRKIGWVAMLWKEHHLMILICHLMLTSGWSMGGAEQLIYCNFVARIEPNSLKVQPNSS